MTLQEFILGPTHMSCQYKVIIAYYVFCPIIAFLKVIESGLWYFFFGQSVANLSSLAGDWPFTTLTFENQEKAQGCKSFYLLL